MSTLPFVELRGPDIPRPLDPNVDAGAADNAFWVLIANAPQFQRKKEKEPQEGRIHTLRALLADVDAQKRGDLQWRMPRLMTLHVIAGDLGRFTEEFVKEKEQFFVRLPKQSDPVRSVKSGNVVFHTTSGETKTAAFQQIAAEPLFDLDTWPKLDEKIISVPPFRLVAGAIELRLTGDALDWLGPLVKKRTEIIVRFTPDGIELDATVTFPGVGDLDGRFLLYPTAAGTRLRLLSDHLDRQAEARWRAAWNAVMAKRGEEESINGVSVEPRREGLIPQFEWDASTSKKVLDTISSIVTVPGADLRVRLLSPVGKNGIDGEVTLKPDVFSIAPFDRALMTPRVKDLTSAWKENPAVMLTASIASPAGGAPMTRFVIDAVEKTVRVKLEATGAGPTGHVCAHDEVALARALRAANGFDELLPDRPDPARPLLAGFVPLDDGWLQLPIPNLPPPDVAKDDVPRMSQGMANVLSGYLRYASIGNAPAVLSAFPPVSQAKPDPFTVDEAPWVITIEAASLLDFVAGIAPGSAGDGTAGTLLHAAASLDGPELTTRGLMWISSDRPDALEALPRLGAGAGVYVDVPLETFDTEKPPMVQFMIDELAISVTRGTPLDVVSRDGLALHVGFDRNDDWKRLTKDAVPALDAARAVLIKADPTPEKETPQPVPPVVWRRHPTMPLAAAMPMTRGAASAVRPLESRDLIPFTVDVDDETPLPLVALRWPHNAVFPDVTRPDGDPLSLRPVAAWPWPPDPAPAQPKGIALVAFGVPGAEVALLDDKSSAVNPWASLRFALRYDLPALDEAFATASLPPQPPGNAPPEERQAPVPTPLAHDWPAMARFWGEQNRTHQLARVNHSYLADHRAVGDGSSKPTEVQDLIGGATWSTKTGFKLGEGDMPYGTADVGGTAVSKDDALVGISGTFAVSGNSVTVNQAAPSNLIGYAPASFIENGFQMDSRRTGTRKAVKKGNDRLLWRDVAIPKPGNNIDALVTLVDPVPVGTLFSFWFKDLPVAGGTFTPSAAGIDFNAWQDGHLPVSGFEWRLVTATADAAAIFERGRDRVPFFGFLLEPLRLDSLTLAFDANGPTGVIASAVIRARLYLGPVAGGPAPDSNVVVLTLENDGAGRLIIKDLHADDDLRFAFPAAEPGAKITRRVFVKGRCGWDAAQSLPSFTVSELTVSLFGDDRSFEKSGATLTPATGTAPLKIEWNGTAPTSPIPGRGSFVVENIVITTNVDSAGDTDIVHLTLTRRLVITPRGPTRGTVTPPRAAVEAIIAADQVKSLHILRLELKNATTELVEGHDALTLTVTADVPAPEPAKMPPSEIIGAGENPGRGLPVQGHFSLGLAASLDTMVNGAMEIIAGWLDGEIVAPPEAKLDKRVAIRRLAIHAEQRRRPEHGDPIQVDWIGGIAFYGKLSLDNAIGWPGIVNGGDIDPDPANSQTIKSGTSTVTIDPATFHVHKVDYVLDGHRLPFDVAARLDAGLADVVWSTPAVATHTFIKNGGGETLQFTAVETFALGTATAIVPVLGPRDPKHPERSYQDDPVTFGARHREKFVKGEETNQLADGMVLAGTGRVATVLGGALGVPFRAAFTTRTGLFLAGGFAGIVDAEDGGSAPLLRLPVLVAIDPKDEMAKPGVIQSAIPPSTTVTVAWADGRAVRNVISTLRSAVTPASASESALRVALLAGSRAVSSIGLPVERTAMAVLVEQCWISDSDNLVQGDLNKTPFFVGAAVALARLLAHMQHRQSPVVLSLLAGRGDHPAFFSGLASAVVTRDLPLASAADAQERLRGRLVTVGNDFVVHEWAGPPVVDLEAVVPLALVAAPAFADHADPRVAIIRSVSGGRSHFDAPQLPRHRGRPRSAVAPVTREFADGGRGYAIGPGKATLRWLAGPEEGSTMPFRDVGSADSSGLAGLSRPIALPAHASAVAGDGVPPASLGMVWVAQSRVPVYLPLALEKLAAPPIPWLTPGSPRPRNPAADTLTDALRKLQLPFNETGGVMNLQPIVPEMATMASVSDRAGISLARIVRLETAAGTVPAFDARYTRFGRPAQGGSWSTRTERTPRPGPLPPNRGDEERDRRPCVSRIRPVAPLDAVAGPADRVTGEANADKKLGAWSVTFVAAEEWNGMITDSWDSTILLHAEVEVEGKADETAPPEAVRTMLFRLLFPRSADGTKLQSRANLVIGGVVVPFVRMHASVDEAGKFKTVPAGLEGRENRRGVVKLVLDARTNDASPQRGAAHPAIAEAFKTAELPAVEVQLVVHPDSSRDESPADAVSVLTVDTDAPAIAEGESRAPVTLRMPLAPVVRSHGALPLAPTSILFLDPAYDVSLSSAPAQDRDRLSEGSGPRGALTATLYADRGRVNRRGSITFMIDVAYEKKLDGRAQLLADGDLISSTGTFDLKLRVVPKTTPVRDLFVAKPSPVAIAGFTPPDQPKVTLAHVYELPLSSLVEADGTAAALAAGDVLEMRVGERKQGDVGATVRRDSTGSGVLVQPLHTIAVERRLLLTLTDEPVVEPPPALYAALVRRAQASVRLSLPLYAQSPLPLRVDLRDARGDFRRGVMRRTATFIWTLARPKDERAGTKMYVVKSDRNGQTHLPATPDELVEARTV